jgi:hypothetical protein
VFSATLGSLRDSDWTRILGWPGYRVWRSEIDEPAKRLKLWVRRKRGNRALICSGCGRPMHEIAAVYGKHPMNTTFNCGCGRQSTGWAPGVSGCCWKRSASVVAEATRCETSFGLRNKI